ncbi:MULTISPECIES: hypothetical protein [Staphylococcus]|uniref:hypothetical protein n=1 Tax=Staphylococcus TaxID=1279 RepID=UPI0015E0A81A|nr:MULTISPECIES: hypothetical protein [Staphylococcus]MEB5784496.1 hypothetical protein [Staphylococcus pseudoxylosus]
MLKSNLIRIIVALLLVSAITVFFTIGFGWVCQILIIFMFVLSMSYPYFKTKDEDNKNE